MEQCEQEACYISHCQIGGVYGEGYGANRKESVQQAALDIIHRMDLATEEDIKELKDKKVEVVKEESGGVEEVPKDIKDLPPMTENKQYLRGNYRGALQEFLSKAKIVTKLNFSTRDEDAGDARIFITTCKAERGNYEDGVGHASTKKAAIHFASLDFMLKMGLLTMEEHLAKHPDQV